MTELVLLRAEDDAALAKAMSRLVEFLDRVPDVRLLDVAYTASQTTGECVIAIVAGNTAELRSRLASARDRLASGGVRRLKDKSGTYYFREHLLGDGKGRLAFVYPGVPGFYPDMLRDLAVTRHECREAFDELEEALSGNSAFTPSSFIFPPAPYYRHDADIFKAGAYAQALVSTYAANAALTRLLASGGIVPDGVVGFAGGDLAAMMRSGAAGEKPTRNERVRIVRDIYNIVDRAVNHGGLPEVVVLTVLLRKEGDLDEVIRTFPADKVSLSVDFSPRQQTFVVAKDYEREATEALTSVGARVMKLPLDRPFNTPLCESLVPAIRKFATSWMKFRPKVDVYSCATAARLAPELKEAREDTAARWASPVRLTETIRRMYDDGYRVFLEVGPRGLITAAVADTLKGEEHAAIALNSIHRSGMLQLQHAIGQLVAHGAKMDISQDFRRRGARLLDFDSAVSLEVRRDSEMRLSRKFPRMTLLSSDTLLPGVSPLSEPKGRGAKAVARAAAVAQQARRQRQFDFGAMNPLVSDADTIESTPGVSVEITKLFRLRELPFIGDFALGTSQVSYSDPNLKGLVLLTMPLGAEIMAETAELVAPNRHLLRIEDFECRSMVSFDKGELRLFMRAERVASSAQREIAIKVQLRDDKPNSAYTWPVMEATFVLSETPPAERPAVPEALSRPRSVHWSGREIYPSRISYGNRLRGINFVEAWSESGLDYEVRVPQQAGSVVFTRFPLWVVNPLLLAAITSGFSLWRSHERFAGAFSFSFRLRKLTFGGMVPKEGENLRCYLRLTGVTPKSHICDITVSDGNGQGVFFMEGWEELTERVPKEFRELVLQPAVTYLTESFERNLLGDPSTDVASAFVTDVPYQVFERNEGLWLRILSRVILNGDEYREFSAMTGSVSRRAEWLFGRAAAKEAVRRFLKDFYQARWSDADIQIWPDDSGKPHALGVWSEFLSTKLDIAIAHTSQFVVALAAANAHVGVDVESVSRNLSDEFANGVFIPEERELAAQSANSSLTLIRFWCAKEAVSKAFGTGIRYSPKEMVVVDYQPDGGQLTMRLEGAWAEAFKVFKGRDIGVTVRTIRDHALAFCFIPSTLFNDEL